MRLGESMIWREDGFQRGRESMHSEMEALRVFAREAGFVLRATEWEGHLDGMDACPLCACPKSLDRHSSACPLNAILTKLAAAGLLPGKEGEDGTL